jgi:putative PIN family toxin of toxin-antitoxin system
MRVFFDTNVLIAAFISHGICAELFEHCLTRHAILTTEWILDEYRKSLKEKFAFDKHLIEMSLSLLETNLTVVEVQPLEKKVCRDADDDNVLAGALSGKADCLITGDKDLLILKKFTKIPIISPKDFWKLEAKTSEKETDS